MNHVVVIEIGTNSIKALTVELTERRYRILSDEVFPVRPGQGLTATGSISDEAMQRILQTISRILTERKSSHPCQYHIIATESLRKATNAEDLTSRIYQACKLETIVLNNAAEAQLSFLAGTLEYAGTDESIAVLDIGGGSTEITLGCKGEIKFSRSFAMGAVRLTEQYIKHDPVTVQDIISLKAALAEQTSELKDLPQTDKLVGIGGTVTALALLQQPDVSKINGMQLSLEKVQQRIGEFISLNYEQRNSLPGMPQGRADIILAGSLILSQFMQSLDKTGADVCTRGVRHGYFYSLYPQSRP